MFLFNNYYKVSLQHQDLENNKTLKCQNLEDDHELHNKFGKPKNENCNKTLLIIENNIIYELTYSSMLSMK